MFCRRHAILATEWPQNPVHSSLLKTHLFLGPHNASVSWSTPPAASSCRSFQQFISLTSQQWSNPGRSHWLFCPFTYTHIFVSLIPSLGLETVYTLNTYPCIPPAYTLLLNFLSFMTSSQLRPNLSETKFRFIYLLPQ